MAVPPMATYRLQLQPGFGFADAAEVVPYLAALGVSHVYLSPVLRAAPGSTHGYDIVDPSELSEALGGEDGWAVLRDALRRHDLGAVLDLVPNHLCIAPAQHNPAFWAMLRDGPDSPYARWFDVDWEAQDGRILLPVLAAPVGECLDTLTVRGDVLRYRDHAFPLTPGTKHLPLPQLLEAQHYRLAYWRIGAEELNYRRFFDIDTLAGLAVEDRHVFEATHARILRLLAGGEGSDPPIIAGVRIDHPDGLADPGGYLELLHDQWDPGWVVVEKILAPHEELPQNWRCHGTTGYDAAQAIDGLLIDPEGRQPLLDLYARFTGVRADFAEAAAAAKHLICHDVLVAEVDRLTTLLARICAADVSTRDHTQRWLRDALVELLVAFDVYRTYLRPGEAATQTDTRAITRACETAGTRLPERNDEIALIGDLLRGTNHAATAEHERAEFVVRFQQTCATVTAKGVEDTAFYRWFPLLSRGEVGGDPSWFACDLDTFHSFCTRLQRDWPATMTTLSTHDTKRGEDVRARLAVLSELPDVWADAVDSWQSMAPGGPDPNVEYLAWQTLVGAWPVSEERLTAYIEKAIREAKTHTSWTRVDETYEHDVHDHIAGIYASPALLHRIEAFVARIARHAWSNSLAQKLIQLTMPGVPDTYQGSELGNFSLVDPDNRRPVDFSHRERVLAGSPAAGDDWVDGTTKLHLTSRTLRLRRRHPEWFDANSSYEPLRADGPAAHHLVSFTRAGQVLTVAPRLPSGLAAAGGWRDTALPLPGGTWRDVLTGHVWSGRTPVAELLHNLPVALLTTPGVPR